MESTNECPATVTASRQSLVTGQTRRPPSPEQITERGAVAGHKAAVVAGDMTSFHSEHELPTS